MRVYFRSSISVVVPFFIFWNAVVFFFWLMLGPYSPVMKLNFLVSWQALVEGRWWTVLFSVFSHQSFLHLFLNLYVLSSFGPPVERLLGSGRFFRFYLAAGIVGSVAHALTSAFFLGTPEVSALGASGAVAGVVIFFSLKFPKEKILILGILPVPALIGALLFIGLDVWGLMSQVSGGGLPIGHGAHLGGAFTGILAALFMRSPPTPKPPRATPSEDVVDIASRRL